MKRILLTILPFFLISWGLYSQVTSIPSGSGDATQAGNNTFTGINIFTGATFRVPNSTTLPATCTVGDAYMDTNATSGQRWYLCESTNTWVVQGGSGGASDTEDLNDCKVTIAGAVATVTAPCSVRQGAVLFTLASSATATLSGTSTNGTVYFYRDSAGVLTAAENTSATLTCNANCTAVTTTLFPADSFPLASVAFVANEYTTVTDLRSFLSMKTILCGTGLTCSENGSTGETTLTPETSTTLLTKATHQSGAALRCASSEGTDAHVCSLSPAIASYTDGMVIEFEGTSTGISGAATINVNGLGVKNIKQADGSTDPDTSQIAAGQQVSLRYDGTSFRLPPTTSASSTYIDSDAALANLTSVGTTDTTAFTATIPAIAAGRGFKFYAVLADGSGCTSVAIIKAKYDTAGTPLTLTVKSAGGSASRELIVEGLLLNDPGSTTAQTMIGGSRENSGGYWFNARDTLLATGTINTGSSKTFEITVACDGSTSTFVRKFFLVTSIN